MARAYLETTHDVFLLMNVQYLGQAWVISQEAPGFANREMSPRSERCMEAFLQENTYLPLLL